MRKLLFALMMFLTMPAQAEQTSGTVDDVDVAEAYLNNLTTARARFVQITPDGSRLTGTFYLSRPGKLRFEYDPPVNDFVVADGRFIYFYDSELGQQSNAPIGETLADFLLRREIELDGEDVVVTSVSRGADMLQITAAQSADVSAGNIRLGFSETPFMLKKWRVTDVQGGITEIQLADLETDIDLDQDLFFYRDPGRDVIRFNE